MKSYQSKLGISVRIASLIIAIVVMTGLCFWLGSCGKRPEENNIPNTSTNPSAPSDGEGEGNEDDFVGDPDDVPSDALPEQPPVEEPPAVLPEEKPEEKPPAVAPVRKSDVLVCSKVDSLSVRAGAGTNYKRLGVIDKGDMLSFVSKANGWYKVRYLNGYGYVSGTYVYEREFDKGNAKTERVIDEGKKVLGTPYVYGAQRYHFGGKLNNAFVISAFDCSSLMQYIFKVGADVDLDTTSRSQSVQGALVAKDDMKRGDLLFFTNESRKNNVGIERIGHVALYLGDNYILNTASDYAVIEEMSAKRHSYFICARRLIP